MYDACLLPCGWKCYKLKDIVKACQTTKHKDMAQEFIWVNYELPEMAKYVISMNEYQSIGRKRYHSPPYRKLPI